MTKVYLSRKMSKPPDSPEKLTIQCLLNILSVQDKSDLRNKIWDERVESLWLGIRHRSYDDDETPIKLVVANNRKEAISKLRRAEFFDFPGNEEVQKLSKIDIVS